MLQKAVSLETKIAGGVKSAHYIGMSATSLYNWQKTHREDHKAGHKANVMVKHDIECHEGNFQKYTTKLVKTERSLLYLTLREAILIKGQLYSTSVNERHKKCKGTDVIHVN